MINNILIFTLLIITLQGCNSSLVNSRPEVQTESFVIFGNNQNKKSHIQLNGSTLSLGDIDIKNWPLKDLFCSSCDITLDRRVHPNGPTTWIIAIDKNITKTWIMSSYQKQFSVDQWQVKHVNDKVIITSSKSKDKTKFNSNIQSPVAINSDENCALLWSKKELLDQPRKNIAPDIAKFKSQFIIQCEV